MRQTGPHRASLFVSPRLPPLPAALRRTRPATAPRALPPAVYSCSAARRAYCCLSAAKPLRSARFVAAVALPSTPSFAASRFGSPPPRRSYCAKTASFFGGMEPVEEPRAEKRPFRLVTHGDVRIDDYYYLREREDAAVQDYIQQEMKYCSTMMKDTESLQAELYDELLARVQETDRSYPYLIRSTNSAETEQQENYFYYHRTEQGKKYKIHCRKRLTTVTDEWSEEEAAKVEEEVILDENEYAERLELNFLSVGDMEVSPNQRYLAYSVDTEGGERFELRVKDLSTGQDVDEPIHDVYYSVQWSNDSNYLFYVTVDDAMRPFKVWRHRIGTSVADDVLIYHEEDDAFFVSVTKTSSEKYLLIYSNSQITSEAHFSDAFDPEDPFTVVQPRIHKMEYSVEEHDGEFWIVTNHEAKNFRVMKTKVDNPSMDYWEEVIPHNPAVKVNSLAIFKNFAVVKERENGLNQLRIIDLTNSNRTFSASLLCIVLVCLSKAKTQKKNIQILLIWWMYQNRSITSTHPTIMSMILTSCASPTPR
ncbi:Oligopeptidase B [Balamuthia mandrillaris]